MRRLAFALTALLAATTASANPELPRPPALEPNVRFWTRVYSEVDTKGGLIHDSANLGVVYEVVSLPEGLSDRARERRVEDAKDRYRAILRKLGRGERTGLSAEEQRVLSLWPAGTSDRTFQLAAGQLRFQLGQADKFRAGLVRSAQWSDHISSTLEAHGVPGELVALPHVESSFNPRAYSRVGAAGLWQFMRATGRRYMRVDEVVDERMDPHKATVGAARLLRDNYRRLQAWPLAITAYNHGASGIERAARSLGTRDIGVIAQRYQSRIFGFASRNFYAEFLAASQIHQDPERYFGKIPPEPSVAFEILVTDHYYRAPTLGRALGVDLDVLRDHNLALRPAVWNGAKYVPKGYALRIPRSELREPLGVLMAKVARGERFEEQKRDRFHKVRRGETLGVIARRYDVRESELVAVNGLRSRNRISVGQVLRLPADLVLAPEPVAVASAEPARTPAPAAVDLASAEPAQPAATAPTPAEPPSPAPAEVASAEPPPRTAPEVASAEPARPAPREIASAKPVRPEPASSAAAETASPEAAKPEVAEVASAEPVAVARTSAPASAEVARASAPVSPPATPVSWYEVRRGDTLERIAGRFGVSERELAAMNGLHSRHLIRAGQRLRVAGEAAAREEARPAPAPTQVAAAEEPPDAERDEPAVAAGAEEAEIEAGESPEASDERPAGAVVAEAPSALPAAVRSAAPDPSNYAVTADQRITVQAEETIGHYAEWLAVRASRLREINGMRASTPLVIGRQRKLDFSRVSPDVFEQRRLEYHRTLQEEFFEAFEVTGSQQYVLRKGDTIWQVARQRFEIPMWLLVQYNPDLDFGALSPGTSLAIPVVAAR
jgi:membrane-bound lytic murein transglycosylase D